MNGKSEGERAIERLEGRWQNVNPGNLPYHILLLGKLIDRVTAQHVREIGDLALAEWRVVAHLSYLKKCSATEIANLAFVDRAEVSRALNTLEERGLVKREKMPENRKVRIASLTAEGMRVHDDIRKERSRLFAEWVADLSGEERDNLDSSLRSIIRRIVLTAPDMVSP